MGELGIVFQGSWARTTFTLLSYNRLWPEIRERTGGQGDREAGAGQRGKRVMAERTRVIRVRASPFSCFSLSLSFFYISKQFFGNH